MKIYKLLFLTVLSCFVISCSQDKFEDQTTNDSSERLAASQFDDSYLGVYKGLFSTNDGLTRGSVVVTLSPSNDAVAQLTLSSGEMIELVSSRVKLTADNAISNLRFSSAGLSPINATLDFSVEGNGLNPSISNVIFDDKESDILIAKNLSRAPLNTITGTYMRTSGSGGFPSSNRTWNIMSIGAGDNLGFATQIFYGNRLYTTMPTGTQGNCVDNTDGTDTCDITGSAMILGYAVNWTGTHTYDNGGGNEGCSAVSGDWTAPAYGNSQGTFISDSDCSSGPVVVNDFCADATIIANGETISGSTENSTAGDAPTDCALSLNTGPGIWFSYTASLDGVAVVDTNGSDYDTKLGVLGGTCGALICIDSDDDGGNGLQSLIQFDVTSGETYYFYVTGFGTGIGTYVVNLAESSTPTNDLCEDAESVSCGDSLTGTNLGASNTGTPDTCTDGLFAPFGDNAVWYTFTTATDQDVTVDTEGSDFDTQVRVFSGTCSSLTCIGADDDDGTGLLSSFTFTATANETYLIIVAGYANATGNFTLNVSCTTPQPPAPPLTCGDFLIDDGGAAGDYTTDQFVTYNIEATAGNTVSLAFSEFALEDEWDFMRIYDGDSQASPEITDVNGRVVLNINSTRNGFTGTGTGANSLEGQTVNSSGQFLTVVFFSDDIFVDTGFNAAVSCISGRSSMGNQKTSLTYRPAVSNSTSEREEVLEAVEISKRNKIIAQRRLIKSKEQ